MGERGGVTFFFVTIQVQVRVSLSPKSNFKVQVKSQIQLLSWRTADRVILDKVPDVQFSKYFNVEADNI